MRRTRVHFAVMKSTLSALLAFAVAALLFVSPAYAQRVDTVRAGVTRPVPDALPASSVATRVVRTPQADADSLTPPISPRRAFLYSFLFPGAGQAALGRAGAGGTFFLVEVAALALVHRSAEDLRIARAFRHDSIPLRYQYDPMSGVVARGTDGEPVVAEWSRARYDSTWVKTRRLHYEDWLAVLFFNHLFAGADAFVAAQLWDLPGKVAIRRTPYGSVISLAFPFR